MPRPTPSRAELRDRLVEHARSNPSCTAAAILGSGARGTEDIWSDIDLAIRLAPQADLNEALAAWSTWLRTQVPVSDHMDVHAAGAVYRVFLCESSLQIDLSLWPWERFRAMNGEPMKLVFGEALEPAPVPIRGWAEHARLA